MSHDRMFEHNRQLYYDQLLPRAETESSSNDETDPANLGQKHSIRLLTVWPGKFQDPLRCALTTEDLTPQLAYGALSYTWGQGTALRTIELNQRQDYQVTSNAFAALRRIRHKHEPRRLWVDAICICQTNLVEKGYQVSIMTKIYYNAQVVLCWLGPCGTTPLHGEESEDCSDHNVGVRDRELDIACHKSPLLHVDPEQGQWWDRVWTVQEFCLAKETRVLIGCHVYTHYEVECAFYLQHRPDDDLMWPKTTQPILKRYQKHGYLKPGFHGHLIHQVVGDYKKSLYECLVDTAHCQATDSRDKVFAVLGLSRSSGSPNLRPDYDLGTKAIDVFRRAAREICFTFDPGLKLIVDMWPRYEGTWVPNFAAQTKDDRKLWSHKSCDWQRDVSNQWDPKLDPRRALRGNDLEVAGMRVDRVAAVVGGFRDGEVMTFLAAPGSHLTREVSQSTSSFGNQTGLSSELEVKVDNLKSVVREHLAGSKARAYAKDEDVGAAFARVTECGSWLPRFALKMSHSDSLKATLPGSTFFLTDGGYMGISNGSGSAVRVGDEVVLVCGVKIPLILRRRGEQYQTIDEAYIEGMMDGELRKRYRGSNSLKFWETKYDLEKIVLIGDLSNDLGG